MHTKQFEKRLQAASGRAAGAVLLCDEIETTLGKTEDAIEKKGGGMREGKDNKTLETKDLERSFL